MKIALIDNNDSFTYNIVDYLRRLENVKFRVMLINKVNVSELGYYDKIILSPGPGLPSDFYNLNMIIESFFYKKPILGICLGHQALAMYFGAKLININPVIHGQAHRMTVVKPSLLFDGLPDVFNVGLYHSWAVSPEGFPDQLSIDAFSEQNIIMSFSAKEYPVWGVQFHPESYITENGFEILKKFVEK